MEEFKASVFRKVTIRLIPFLILAYLLNYIDRVNLGFAALQMNRDLRRLLVMVQGFSLSVISFLVSPVIWGCRNMERELG